MAAKTDFSFSLPGFDKSQRRAYRTEIPGLSAREIKTGREFPVHDLSALGAALVDVTENELKIGHTLTFDLHIAGKRYVDAIEATIRRVTEDGALGVTFDNLDRRTEARLDKLVLEVQKLRINQRREQEERNAPPPSGSPDGQGDGGETA